MSAAEDPLRELWNRIEKLDRSLHPVHGPRPCSQRSGRMGAVALFCSTLQYSPAKGTISSLPGREFLVAQGAYPIWELKVSCLRH